MNHAEIGEGSTRLVAHRGGRKVGVFSLVEGAEHVLGASSEADLRIAGERFLSRRHALLRCRGTQLDVERIPGSTNPIVFNGTNADRFTITPGEYFVIGTTTFRYDIQRAAAATAGTVCPDPAPSHQFTLGADELAAPRDPSDRLKLLNLMGLTEVLRTKGRGEFFNYAAGLLRMVTAAQWVRIVRAADAEPVVLAEDAAMDRLAAKPVSRSLVQAAIAEAPNPVAYCWGPLAGAALVPSGQPAAAGRPPATAYEGIDWAICCAMSVPGEPPILFYLAGATHEGVRPGHAGVSGTLRDAARLVGLVADMIGRTMVVERLQTWQTRLSHFFSDRLVSRILDADATEALAPHIRETTVMFFDIRGFSLLTEGGLERILEHQGDLRRVLTAMTQCVFDHEGVVIRYMGDGILACWNVPYDLSDHVEMGCRAAMEMVGKLSEVTGGWGCGIGLAVGDVVAGSLGSDQVYAYDILGPVVNQAARIEGITKIVGVPILVTEAVATRVSRDRLLPRRVARFLPVGMETELDLYTIERAPEAPAARQAIEERHALHARALAAFEQGDWKAAFDLLHPIVKDDAAARYVYTVALQGHPPRGWRGVVELTAK